MTEVLFHNPNFETQFANLQYVESMGGTASFIDLRPEVIGDETPLLIASVGAADAGHNDLLINSRRSVASALDLFDYLNHRGKYARQPLS